MLIELMRPGGVELSRRWLAALLVAPADEREAIVSSVERRMVEAYRSGGGGSLADDWSAGGGVRGVSTPPRTELREMARRESDGGEELPRKARKKAR